MTFFHGVGRAKVDPIFGLNQAFLLDGRPERLNLIIGAYRDEEQRTPIMKAVKEAERAILLEEKTKEYLPISGDILFLQETARWILSSDIFAKVQDRLALCQGLGGTGSLRIAADFLSMSVSKQVWISDPTWANHSGIFTAAGFTVQSYPYYDRHTNILLFDSMLSTLEFAEEKSVVLLHACCHNPSGLDLSDSQWQKLLELMQRKKLLPFFDAAYVGLGRGCANDAKAIRLFAESGLEMLVAISFSKNFSLYGERVGAILALAEDASTKEDVLSQLKIHARRSYSNPPLHGARIVANIFTNSKMAELWEDELSYMRQRMQRLKEMLYQGLSKAFQDKDYSYITKTQGMFCFSGLTEESVHRLIQDYGIYMPYDGRINIAGLNSHSIDTLVSAMRALQR